MYIKQYIHKSVYRYNEVMKVETTQEFDNHQVEAIAAGADELAINDRCKIIMACGTGKTRVGRGLAQKLNARTVVVYVPSIALIRQMLPEWLHNNKTKSLDFLCICSDETVTSQGDEMAISTAELIQHLGIDQRRVTTNSDGIRSFLEKNDTDLRYVFCTYHSSNVLSESLPEGFCFDLAVFDEAHRTAGTNTEFSGPLSDSHTPIAKRVFMTATPKHFKLGKKNRDGDLQLAYSMDDENIYGRTAYHLPIRKAINLGIISDYEILVSVIDDLSATRAVHTDKLSKHEAVSHAIAIRNAMNEYGLKKVVTFHNTVSEAKFFAENDTIKTEIGVPLFHVSGQQNMGERTAMMSAFEHAENSLVTNSRCLTEGVDVPEIDLIAFLHPKKSAIDIIQAIGRALRKPRGSNKGKGYILLPLYVTEPTSEGLEKALKEYGYDTIFEVVQALREQDQSVDAAIREAGVAKVKQNNNIDELPFLKPTWNNQRVDVLRNLITTKIVEELTISWDVNFEILKEISQDGNANIPVGFSYKDINIGKWLHKQRQRFKQGTLLPKRRQLLESIGVQWSVSDYSWHQAFSLLNEVYTLTGSSNVAWDLNYKNFNLGEFTCRQRVLFKKGKLSQTRIEKLNSLGFIWDLKQAQWEYGFSLLKEIFLLTGSSDISQKYLYKNFNLGNWVRVQRDYYRANKLSNERVNSLNSIGFVWNSLEKSWQTHFDLLKTIYENTGNANVSARFVYMDYTLGRWLALQRINYRQGLLESDRIKRLETIGVKWNLR